MSDQKTQPLNGALEDDDGAIDCHCGRPRCDCQSSRTRIADEMRASEPYVCDDFLPTCRDSNRCHICLQPREAHERRLSLAEHCQEQPRRCPDCGSMARCKCGKEWERDE